MNRQIVCVLLLLLTGLGVSAQTTEKTVETIRKRYNEIAEKARLAVTDNEQGELGSLFVNELKINSRNHQWRAVGIYHSTLKFFYRSLDTEGHMYPDQLVFVTNDRQHSDRRYHDEWLFSESGELVFYFNKSESDPEIRIYFSGGKPVRTLEGNKIHDRLSAKELKDVAKIVANARKLKEIFKLSM